MMSDDNPRSIASRGASAKDIARSTGAGELSSPTPLAHEAPTLGPPGPPTSGEWRRKMIGWRNRDILRAALLVFGVYFTLRLLWIANAIILVTFLGVLFGLAVSSGVDRLARLRIPRGISAALIVFGFFGLVYGLGVWMAPTLREQGRELRSRLPEAVDRVEGWINSRPGIAGIVLGGTEVSTGRDSVAASGVDTANANAARERVIAGRATQGDSAGGGQPAVPSLRQRLSGQLGSVTRYLFPFLSSTITIVGGLLLIVVLSIYVAAEPRLYHAGLMHLFPHRARARAGEVLSTTAVVLRRWLVTQLIAMVAIGVVTTITLLILRVKAAFALGILAGFLEFVPTIGPIISAVPAIAMAFLDSPQKALSVGIAYIVIQQLENHILIPMLMKEGVDLPPALTIIAQALMALFFGFLGLMVAVPLLAAVIVPIKMLYVEGVVGDDLDTLDEEG